MTSSTPGASSLSKERGKQGKMFNYCPSIGTGKHSQDRTLCLGNSRAETALASRSSLPGVCHTCQDALPAASGPEHCSRTRQAGRNKGTPCPTSRDKEIREAKRALTPKISAVTRAEGGNSTKFYCQTHPVCTRGHR